MWTLGQLRTRLSQRLGEDSTVFWREEERDSYLNEAQRRVAAMTGGVTKSIEHTVTGILDPLILPPTTLGVHEVGGDMTDGTVLTVLNKREADYIWPGWRRAYGKPRWIVLDVGSARAFAVPAPPPGKPPLFVGLTVAYLPPDLTSGEQVLFESQTGMEKYQGATVTLAACLGLLKERYDGDAERFYSFFVREMQDVGMELGRLPSWKQVQQEAPSG